MVNDGPPSNPQLASLIKKSKIDFRQKKPLDLASRLKRMRERGLMCKNSNEIDTAFIMLKRYLDICEFIKNTKEYRGNPAIYDELMSAKQIEDVKLAYDGICESINANSLKVNKNAQDILNSDRRLTLNDTTDKDALDITLNFPETPTDEPVNDAPEEFITCMDLYKLLTDSKILIIDIRPTDDYEKSHIKINKCVNIPPSEIKNGILVKVLENYVRVHRGRQEEKLFQHRSQNYINSIILLDWMTTRDKIKKLDHIMIMRSLLTSWDPGNKAPNIYFLDGGYCEWLNVYPGFVTNSNIKPPSVTSESDAMDEILEEIEYPEWLTNEQLIEKNARYRTFKYFPKKEDDINSTTKSNFTKDTTINSNEPTKSFVYIDENSTELTRLSHEVGNIDLITTTKKIPSGNSTIAKPPIDRSSKPLSFSNNPQSQALLDLLKQIASATEHQKKFEQQISEIDSKIHLKYSDDEYDLDDLDELREQRKIVELSLENTVADKNKLKNQLNVMKRTAIPMNRADKREEEELDLKIGGAENTIATITMNRKIQIKQQEEKRKMLSTPNDNNNLTYKEPLRSEGSPTNTSLKRSLSSPNLPQVKKSKIENQLEDRKIPEIDRSSKPLTTRKNVRETNNNLQISCRDPEKRMDPVYRNGHPGITGLKNLGNSCYMNSIIQCLSNTAYLAKYFIENSYQDDLNTNSDNETRGQIAVEFAHVIKALWRGQYKSIAPRDLKNTIGQHKLQFDSCEQQDSHEFLTFLLDWMHNDLRKADTKIRRDNPLSAAEKEWEKAMEGQLSVVSQLFNGQLRSTICCLTCSSRSITYETFNSLSISLMESYRCSLDECLKNFLSGQRISGWACPNCKVPREATKKFDFVKLAPIMVIHLNRFVGTDVGLEKKSTPVTFPLNDLNLRPYLVIDPDSNQLHNHSRYYNYSLYAISNHYGNMGGGHYTALCKNSALNKWYRYDDQTVTDVTEHFVKTQHTTAYLLFYSSLQCEPSTYI